jgi:hypothetical protein
MTNTYVWTTQSMTCYPTYQAETDVVFVVNTIITATDDSDPPVSAVNGISTAIPYIAEDQFIAYADLTPEIVNGWVQTTLGAEAIANIQLGLDKQITDIINPPAITPPLPWSA